MVHLPEQAPAPARPETAAALPPAALPPAALSPAAEPPGRVTVRFRTVALRVIAGLGAGALLLLTFLHLVDLSQVARHLDHLNPAFAACSAVAFLGAYVVRALRWRRLLRPCRVSAGRSIAIYQVATFLNWLLPVQAGELAKSLLLKRSDGVPVSRSMATVGMDKTMDLLPAVAILTLVPLVGLHLNGLLWFVLIVTLGSLALAAALLLFALWQRDRTLAVLNRMLARVLRGRAQQHIEPAIVMFVDTVLALIRQPRVLLVATVYTGAAASLDALSCLFSFKAVGVAVGLAVVFYGSTFLNLTFVLPTPPAHVGFTEFAGLLVFSGLLGVNRSGVAAMTLFSHPFDGLLLCGSALLGLGRLGLSLRSSLRLIRRGQT